MGSRFRAAARDALAAWGALSLIGLIAAAGVLAYSLYFPGTPREDQASKDDVRFVLNRPGLGDERIESVVRSHESVVHLNGDHFVAYAIRVTSLSESELSGEGRWVRGDRADALMQDAIRFVTTAGHDAPWLPAADELLTDRYFVWRERVEVADRVTAAILIFARPSDRMIFYASLQV